MTEEKEEKDYVLCQNIPPFSFTIYSVWNNVRSKTNSECPWPPACLPACLPGLLRNRLADYDEVRTDADADEAVQMTGEGRGYQLPMRVIVANVCLWRGIHSPAHSSSRNHFFSRLSLCSHERANEVKVVLQR